MTEEGKIGAIADNLRERIKKGDFGTGGRMPSVVQLSKEFNVSRTTLYQALQILQSEALLIARESSFYVNYPIMKVTGAPLFDKYISGQGLTPVTDNIVEPEIAPAPADIATMLGVQEGVHVVHRMRRHGVKDIPYRLAENWYPLDLAGDFVDAMKQNPDLNVLGEIRKNKGVAYTNRYDNVQARLPTAEESKQLSIVRTTPVLEVKRRFVAADERVLLLSNQVLVGAFFELTYELPRHRKDDNEKQS